ncbi:unnamed protein product [Miscanthus lutarioriparius]|uniref:Uncharacterized protein n=1 Tax=Miscanthus lutarioriparius TaxID=422564 RepID=A0A811QMQ9_9POAL|nr:unnamed protein product [Miscanthus lutarioriparius]
MGDAQAPGGYFVGRPANFEDKQQDAADVQNKGSAPDGCRNIYPTGSMYFGTGAFNSL